MHLDEFRAFRQHLQYFHYLQCFHYLQYLRFVPNGWRCSTQLVKRMSSMRANWPANQSKWLSIGYDYRTKSNCEITALNVPMMFAWCSCDVIEATAVHRQNWCGGTLEGTLRGTLGALDGSIRFRKAVEDLHWMLNIQPTISTGYYPVKSTQSTISK